MVTEIMETDKQKQITTIMKKSTNNYERPEVQVVYVETEAGFASESGFGGKNQAGAPMIEDPNYTYDF